MRSEPAAAHWRALYRRHPWARGKTIAQLRGFLEDAQLWWKNNGLEWQVPAPFLVRLAETKTVVGIIVAMPDALVDDLDPIYDPEACEVLPLGVGTWVGPDDIEDGVDGWRNDSEWRPATLPDLEDIEDALDAAARLSEQEARSVGGLLRKMVSKLKQGERHG